MADTFRRIVLASRPRGWVGTENFRLEEVPMPPLGEGQVRVRNRFISLDPYMRGRMNDAKSYAMPQQVGETMGGAAVGEVAESRHPDFAVGDTVRGMLGWCEYSVSNADGIAKVDGRRIPLSAHLGAVGMTGMTAWYGVNKIMQPKQGETVIVSAAAGAVGSVAGQLARIAGARVIGIAGGAEKCRHVTQDLKFDACIDHKLAKDAKSLAAMLAAAAPKGIDAHFENVGGDVLNAVMSLLNPFARVAICGLIADYNTAPGEPLKSAIVNPAMFLVARFKMQGFIISDHLDLWPEGLSALGTLVAAGEMKYRETIAEGLESAPSAFIGMLKGQNLGKQLVRL